MKHIQVWLCRNGKHWQAQWRNADGSRGSRSVGPVDAVTKRDAKSACRAIEREIEASPAMALRRNRLTLMDLKAAYFDARVDITDETRAMHELTMDSLIKTIGPKTLVDAVTPQHAAKWRESLAKAPPTSGSSNDQRSEATVCRYTRDAKTIFNFAKDRGAVAANPFEKLRGTPARASVEFYEVTDDDVEKLLAACPNVAWRRLFALTYYAGLRLGEAQRLAWSDIDLDARTVNVLPKVNANGVRAETTKQKQRLVPICDRLAKILDGDRDDAGPCVSVVNNVFRIATSIIEAAGLPGYSKPFHTLRKCRETVWQNTVGNPMLVSKVMGHSPTVAAAHYHKVTPKALADMMGKATETEKLRAQVAQLQAELERVKGKEIKCEPG